MPPGMPAAVQLNQLREGKCAARGPGHLSDAHTHKNCTFHIILVER